MSQEVKVVTGDVQTADLSSQKLMALNKQLRNLQRTNQGLLHVCDNCVAWSTCKDPGSEIRPHPWCLAGFWEHIPMLNFLPQTLYRERSSVLPQLDVPCFVQSHGRPDFLFKMETEKEWIGKRVDGVRRGSRKEGEGKLQLVLK